MGSRDYRQREAKKPKKGGKKPSISEPLLSSPNVEVVKKRKQKAAGEES